MNIFKHEMRMHRTSIIIWSLSFTLLLLIFMGLYPTIEKNMTNFSIILNNFPSELSSAINIELLTFGNPLGFFSFIFVYVSLIAAIQAMKYGLSILSIEEREKTADFLLSKPVSRRKLLVSKVLAVVTALLITNVIFFLVSYFTVNQYSKGIFNKKTFVLITQSIFFMQLIFMSIGLFISMIPRKIKAVTPITMGVVFGFFIIQMFSSAFDDKSFEYFTPFKYFDAGEILVTQSYNPIYVLLSIAIVVLSLGFTYYRYINKDMAQI